GLSSLVRPLIAFVTAWPQVLALRFTDRLGKGIRTSPRDALVACVAAEKTRVRVYGFHRAMDHAGAVAGPLVATAYLYFHPDAYRSLFGWTLVPGLIVIALVTRLPHQRLTPKPASGSSVSSVPSVPSVPAPPASRLAPPVSRLPPRYWRAIA